jgi:TldD protein
MRMLLVAIVLSVCLRPLPAQAADALPQELAQDVILRALVDELDRSLPGLKLEDLERPYFIEYGLTDGASAYVTANLGAVTDRGQTRGRALRTDVRVGSYELDNSNFGGGGGGGGEGAAMPIDDDYAAIRQAIWWMTDRDYKNVVEELVQKKAFMESKLIQDKPADFARVAPVVHLETRATLQLDPAPVEELAGALSALYRDFPDVQSSSATVGTYVGNKYLVNTEGTRLRTPVTRCYVAVRATVQAEDGMRLSGSKTYYANTFAELPPRAQLEADCRQLAKQLLAARQAPVLASYSGPVLFEPEAATQIFARQFGGAFCGGQRPVGSRTSPDDFANKLNKRILPRFLDVVDDPTLTTVAGETVMGHYTYDDQAVPAQRVALVEHGRLKNLLMSRNPSKEFAQSNGHGRGNYGRAGVGCLVVTSQNPRTADELKADLLEACADEGLEFGLRIAAFGSVGDSGGTTPLLMYKVFPDGHEELVRGAEIARIDLKAFKRMLAAGDKPFVMNLGGSDGQTAAAPAMLFEELDLAKIDRDFDKPPILPAPLARDK